MSSTSAAPAGAPVTNPNGRSFNGFSEITNFIWSIADLLRGDYKQADYGKVILPVHRPPPARLRARRRRKEKVLAEGTRR